MKSEFRLPPSAFILPLLFVGSFSDVLLQERNFVYRDAGHFYYPYFQLACREWSAGRVPLWNPQENGGTPLAGNPTASVFYPLKLIFLLPFPLAYKWYLMGHVGIAWLTCFLAARGFGTSDWGAALAGTCYAFGGFVFFQLYNVVFLCGAAWLPLGILATYRLVKTPSTGWAVGLAVVLALQVLGGDPQVAYLTSLVAFAYASIIFIRLALVVLQVRFVGLRRTDFQSVSDGMQFRPTSRFDVDGLLAKLKSSSKPFCYLAAAGLIALLLSVVQVLPTLDLLRVSDRAAPEAPHEPVAFSFFPARVIELFVPAFFGKQFPQNSRWAPFEPFETGIWIPSMYMGLVACLLGLFSCRLIGGTAHARFLTWLVVLMFWLALGKFGGPSWYLQENPQGPLDPLQAPRDARQFGESDGLYWVCERIVPGFRTFRYPSKMLVFCACGLSLLAGFGLDRLREAVWPILKYFLVLLALTGMVSVGTLWTKKAWFLEWLGSLDPRMRGSLFGPLLPELAWNELLCSLGHFTLVTGLFGILVSLRGRKGSRILPLLPGFVLALLAADLLVANHWLVLTDEQSAIDAKPIVVRAIETEESKEPDPQPFRVHRTRIFHPLWWKTKSDQRRVEEMSRWERETIQPKYGLAFGIQYTMTTGTMSIYDTEFFFAPWVVQTPGLLREKLGYPEKMTYFPRKGFDLWNTKYFVLPKRSKPDHAERGIFTFLTTTDQKMSPTITESEKDDYQVLLNPDAFPRAWIVHRCDLRPTIHGLGRQERQMPMEQLLYRRFDGGLLLWPGPPRREYPLRSVVMLEYDGPEDIFGYASRGPVLKSEDVRFERYEPTLVRMTVQLESAGFLVLADTFHPGWSATIDGHPVPVLRANRAMRAIPLPKGNHVVEMRYFSLPFVIGAALSLPTWLAVLLWSLIRLRKRIH